MTNTEARKQIKALGGNIVATIRDGEFRVNYRGGNEVTAYYTTDAQDAVDTARAMLADEGMI